MLSTFFKVRAAFGRSPWFLFVSLYQSRRAWWVVRFPWWAQGTRLFESLGLTVEPVLALAAFY